MADAAQSYATHRRFFPLFHFFAIPLLVINLIVRIIYAWMHRGARLVWWEVVVALALLAVAFASRVMALTVQNRLIRLEETMRLQRCLPDDLYGARQARYLVVAAETKRDQLAAGKLADASAQIVR